MNRERNRGQSTIEFLLCFVYAFGIIFVFCSVAYNITNGYLIHYATFMASRAYLVADDNSNTTMAGEGEAEQIASEVFKKFKINALIPENGGVLRINTPLSLVKNVFVGAFYKYKSKFPTFHIVGPPIDLNLTSESFLGRIPTRAECLARICKALELTNGGSCPQFFTTFYDDGC